MLRRKLTIIVPMWREFGVVVVQWRMVDVVEISLRLSDILTRGVTLSGILTWGVTLEVEVGVMRASHGAAERRLAGLWRHERRFPRPMY